MYFISVDFSSFYLFIRLLSNYSPSSLQISVWRLQLSVFLRRNSVMTSRVCSICFVPDLAFLISLSPGLVISAIGTIIPTKTQKSLKKRNQIKNTLVQLCLLVQKRPKRLYNRTFLNVKILSNRVAYR